MGLPVYMISDYRSVGYANALLRPPTETYSQVPFGSVDGVDSTVVLNVGGTTLSSQFLIGRTRSTLGAGAGAVVHIDAKSIRANNLVLENGPLTLRLGRFDTKVTMDDSPGMNGLFAGLRAAGRRARPQGQESLVHLGRRGAGLAINVLIQS